MAKSIHIFKKRNVTEKKEKFPVYDPPDVKFLTRLRLQFSLRNEQFRHGFGDTVIPMCGYNTETENTEYFLLRFHFYSTQRFEFFNDINKVDLLFTQLGTKEQVNTCCTVIHQTNLIP